MADIQGVLVAEVKRKIEGLLAEPSKVSDVISGIAAGVDQLRNTEHEVLTTPDAISIVTDVRSLLERLPATRLSPQVLNRVNDIADGVRLLLIRSRVVPEPQQDPEPQQEAEPEFQLQVVQEPQIKVPPPATQEFQQALAQIMDVEKKVESLVAKLNQQGMANSIKNIEFLLNSQKTHEEEKQTEPWPIVASETDTFDLKRAKKWNKEIDTLLLYASLFSAVVATFAVEGVKRDAADSATEGRRDRSNNTLIFASLMVSLATASAGTLVKQWIQQYLEEDFDSTAHHHVCMRQHRYNGLQKWRVPLFVGLLPVILRISFILFSTGLAIRLYDFDHTAAITFATMGGSWVLLSLSAAICPLFSDNCPYRSPESLLVSNTQPFLFYIFRGLIHFFSPFIRFFRRISHPRYAEFADNIPLRFLHHSTHLLLYVLFYFPFYRFLWSLICLPIYKFLVPGTPSWKSWQQQDHGMVTNPPVPARDTAIQKAVEEVIVMRRALGELEHTTDVEANCIQEALAALDCVGYAPNVASIEPPLALVHTCLSTVVRKFKPMGFQGQLERSYGGQRHLVVHQAGRTMHAIDQVRSVMQSWDKTTALGMQALATALLEFAPSNPSPGLTDAIGNCVQSFPPTAALQFVHRFGRLRMAADDHTIQADEFQADKYVEPHAWRQLWRHWDGTGDMAGRICRLTRNECKALLTAASHAVSKAYIEDSGEVARANQSDACFIGDISEPASSCIATLLIRPGLVDADLSTRVAQAILKLLADYEEQEHEPGWASPDGWTRTPLVSLRAAVRLCEDAPSGADDIFESPKDFTVSKYKITKLLRNASYNPDVPRQIEDGQSVPNSNAIWYSVFRTYPRLNPSITAYILLRLASLSDVEGADVDTFFDEWSDHWWDGTLELQRGPWADKVLRHIEESPFGRLPNAIYFKRMFGWAGK